MKGFWMTTWMKENSNSKERINMVNELGHLFESKQLQAPNHKIIPFSQFQEAVSNTLKLNGKTGVKYILDLTA